MQRERWSRLTKCETIQTVAERLGNDSYYEETKFPHRNGGTNMPKIINVSQEGKRSTYVRLWLDDSTCIELKVHTTHAAPNHLSPVEATNNVVRLLRAWRM